MAGDVPANTMRVLIQSVKEVSGRQFEPLLQAAGLTRFAHQLPPSDWSPGASGEEVVRLFSTVYQMLGESCTRLFNRNCGVLFAEGALQGEWGRGALERAKTIPEPERMAWFVRELIGMATRSYSRQITSEDATAWYLASEVCYSCLGIHGVSAPICASAEAMYKALGDKLVGRRIRVAEVECAAMGAPHCKFAIYK